ncbi:hypothetical protein IFM89_025227 [Coptis chinensis]|uniref:Uncharacterized protein n=1 Tax=Coptis chinensis TaxID=261450 RepID=A0A835IX29_9MAGN|nr:hypothetical protein IFM89_025227 [Coptis chinensis]
MSKDRITIEELIRYGMEPTNQGKVFTCRGKFVKLLGTNWNIPEPNFNADSAFIETNSFVTDRKVKRREVKLRDALRSDMQFKLKEGALVEVAQYNPPFTRRNAIALEVERKQD